jgi:ferredoxin
MSSSFTQLVLDLIVFAIFHYYIIFPLIRYILGFITGERETDDSTTVYEFLRSYINEKEEEKEHTIAPFTTKITNDDTECEKCGIPLENQAHVTRQACHCTWCAECVEECFKAVEFDLDAPLKGLSRCCKAAGQITMREMGPWVRDVLEEKTRRYVDTMGSIELGSDDWMFDVDVDELEE